MPEEEFPGDFIDMVIPTDLNGDGSPDLVISPGIASGNLVFYFDNERSFEFSGLSIGSSNLGTVDFDNDGDEDFFNFGSTIFYNNIGLGSPVVTNFDLPAGFSGVTSLHIDLNGDGSEDLRSRNSTTDELLFFLQEADGTFSQSVCLASVSDTTSSQSRDLNNDGWADVVFTGDTDEVFLSDGSGGYALAQTFAMDSFSLHDQNGDGFADAVRIDSAADEVIVRLNNGDGTFAAESAIGISIDLQNSSIGRDLNGDGLTDITSYSGSVFNVILNNGDGTYGAVQTLDVGSTITASYAGANRSGDALPDLVITTNHPNGRAFTYLGSQNRDFNFAGFTDLGGLISNALGDGRQFDFNGDGFDDLLASTGSDLSAIYLNDGDGTYTQSDEIDHTGFSHNAFRNHTGDFNDDGLLDIVMNDFFEVRVYTQTLGELQESQANIDVSTQAGARDALAALDNALYALSERRAEIGALQSRIASATATSWITAENLSLAKSQILDADIALETSELTRAQILQQAGVGVLSQANVSLQIVLELLRL